VFIPDGSVDPTRFCHRPVIAEDGETLGKTLRRFQVQGIAPDDDVIDQDIILVWGRSPRIITGADILGRLLRRIAEPIASPAAVRSR
jgi:hypothetical protein